MQNEHHEKIIAFILLITLFIAVISIIALLAGSVMTLFGFEYKSVGNIIIFFMIAAIISYPINLIAETLPKVLFHSGRLKKLPAVLLYIIFDTAATAFSLSIVDYFMKTVSASGSAIFIISLLFSLMGIKDIDKKPKGLE